MAGKTLSKYVIPGNRVDIRETKRLKGEEEQTEIKVYPSQIYDILSEDRIEVVMPMEKTKFILLPVGGEYDLFFYLDNSIYQCKAKIAGRDKKNSTYLLIMDITSSLRKDQRREYFRFSCALEMHLRELEEEEITAMEKGGMPEESIIPSLPLQKSVIVDISGGGLRFVSDFKYESDRLLLCRYQLDTDKGVKVHSILGKILNVKEVENRQGVFEHRLQYVSIRREEREEIIRFIFSEERKNLRKRDIN